MKKNITFRFDQSTIDLLKNISNETMIPQSRIVEKAVLEYISKMKKSI